MTEDEALTIAFFDALSRIVGKPAPDSVRAGCRWHPLHSEHAAFDLQGWCATECPSWMTGLGCIEAAETLAYGAAENDLRAFMTAMARMA